MSDAKVKWLSTRLLSVVRNSQPDVATIALLDAAVRVVMSGTGLSCPDACRELGKTLAEIEAMERESEKPRVPQ